MYEICNEVIKFIEETMETRREELTAEGKRLAEVKIQRGIFYGDALHYHHYYLLSQCLPKLKSQIKAVRIYSQDIGMEFGIEKCAMLIMKGGKRHITEGIDLPNREKIRTLGEKEILGNIGSGYRQTSRDERKNLKKSISGERESFSKQNYIAGTL